MLKLEIHKFWSMDGRKFSNDACAARSDFMGKRINAWTLRARVIASMERALAVPNKSQIDELDGYVAQEQAAVC